MKPLNEESRKSLSLEAEERIDAVCRGFEQLCKAGRIPPVEDFLKEVESSEREALKRELLRLQADYSRGQEEPPTIGTGESVPVVPAPQLGPGPMELTLTVVEGPYCGQSFTFQRPDRFLVGRSPKAHFRLRPEGRKDLRVSRLHFLIEVNPPLCRLHDMGSRNKTYVNGQPVASCDLAHGDEIRVGHTTLRVAISEGATLRYAIPWREGTAPEPKRRPALQPWLAVQPRERTQACEAAPAVVLPPSPPPLPSEGACPCCGRAPAEPGSPICAGCRQSALGQPQPVPGYLQLLLLGQGGMGVVSLALRLRDQLLVALKTIQPKGVSRPGEIERFLREAAILRELNHRRIVGFHEMGEACGLIWFAMDYVAGTDAARLLKERGPLPIKPALRIAIQLLQALNCTHKQKFVHRDVKPANVLLETREGRLSVKVADFGLGRIYQASQLSGVTLHNEIGGTLEFMPPEQITHFRDVLPAADQFSAAATLYTLLTGKFIRDLSGPLSRKVDQVLSKPPVPIRERQPKLPRELADVIHRALDLEPGRRYPSVADFSRALLPFAG